MEVNRVSQPETTGYASSTAAGSDKVVKSAAETSKTIDQKAVNNNAQSNKNGEVSREELDTLTQELNSLMQSFNADLHFAVHEKTKHLMVQLIDEKNNKVLKEYPSHEFLDMIARISDYVGVLLDKKA